MASLGADEVVDRTTQDLATMQGGFDVVLDAVGRTSFGRCRHLLRPGAPYLSTDLGPGWQNLALIPLTRWLGDHRVLIPFPTDARGHVLRVRDLLASGDFRPVIDRTFTFDRIVDAYRYVASRRKLGTVVVTLTEDATTPT